MTLFPRYDPRIVHINEMRLLYAMIKKIKVAPVEEIVEHMLGLFTNFSTSISCTSLVSQIANGVGALNDRHVPYLTTPRLIVDLQFLCQGHHLKHDEEGNIVHFFSGYANEIWLPNSEFCLYNFQSLTFTLVPLEEGNLYLAGQQELGQQLEGAACRQHLT